MPQLLLTPAPPTIYQDQGKGNGPIPSNPPVNDPRPTIERVDSSVLSLYETAYRMVGATDNNSIEGGGGGWQRQW